MTIYTDLIPYRKRKIRFSGGPVTYTDPLSPSDPYYLPTLMSSVGGLYPSSFQIVDSVRGLVTVQRSLTGTPGLAHAARQSTDKTVMEFSTKNTPADQNPGDKIQTRRSEISAGNLQIDLGVVYRGAQRFYLRGWDGGRIILGQVHAPRGVGGSPVWAFRRAADGKPCITYVDIDLMNDNTIIWEGSSDPTWWVNGDGTPIYHDFVYEARYGKTVGYLKAWMDGVPCVFTGGSTTFTWKNARYDSNAEALAAGATISDEVPYWKHGIYAAGGIGNSQQLWARYTDVILHNSIWDASARIASPL